MSNIVIPAASIRLFQSTYGEAFVSEIRVTGVEVADGAVSIPLSDWQRILTKAGEHGRSKRKQVPPSGPSGPNRTTSRDHPTAVDLASRATYAAWRAGAAAVHGERVFVTDEEYAARRTACESCSFWDGEARFGLGKCNAPGCGCTKFKWWLATERCTHPDGSKWPELEKQRLSPPEPSA